jgi:hypothetical protein
MHRDIGQHQRGEKLSIWVTTALIMNNYREKLISSIVYWSILSIPLIYLLIIYFYQYIFDNLLISYLAIDPITVSILMTAFLSLSKPIGGVTFALVFWKISKSVGYEKNLKNYMVISGWGILLIFGADQAVVQTLTPYPPFGLATITILNIAGFLMLVGIYNSAVLVSANNELRKSIYRHALQSKLLGQIGRAEMENELQKKVTKITDEKKDFMADTQQPVELDGMELKKYDITMFYVYYYRYTTYIVACVSDNKILDLNLISTTFTNIIRLNELGGSPAAGTLSSPDKIPIS